MIASVTIEPENTTRFYNCLGCAIDELVGLGDERVKGILDRYCITAKKIGERTMITAAFPLESDKCKL